MNRKKRRATAKKRKDAVGAALSEARQLHASGNPAAAEALYRKILAADAKCAEAHHGLGQLALEMGQAAVAADQLGQACALRPQPAWENALGIALGTMGRLEPAKAAFQRAIARDAGFVKALNNLGNLCLFEANFNEAKALFEAAIHEKPDYAEALNNLGVAELGLGETEAAEDAFRQAIAHKPGYADAHNNLGNLLRERTALSAAESAYRCAIEAEPKHGDAYGNLGTVLKDMARLGEAAAAFEQALELGCAPETHSNALFCRNFWEDDSESVFAAHLAWAARHEGKRAHVAHRNPPEADRRLRVGYVSPDFRAHSVAFFVEPLFEAHDRQQVEVFAYGRIAHEDAVTARLKDLSDHWCTTVGFSPDQLAERIRADGIDILVDLAGHTAKNDLLAFARKPAPVQISWLGYPNTTGLAAMDYRLTDGRADPKGAEAFHRERLLRLDGGFLCYRPPPACPPVAPLPMAKAGAVTFGSFNQLAKLSDAALATWAEILNRLPDARLVLKAHALGDAGTRAQAHARFADHGIFPERLELTGFLEDSASHFARYGAIDIALDPFPYNGTTTTFEALTMGVPVLTLAGQNHAGRVGGSILHRLGLEDWIAKDKEAYVAAALKWASDMDGLRGLREDLRPRLEASCLTDAGSFTREVEAAYRTVWKEWCRAARQTG